MKGSYLFWLGIPVLYMLSQLFIKLAAPRIPTGWTPYLPATA